MRILVQGAGIYGCHISTELLAAGHDVAIFDIQHGIFAGASGNIPARLHLGFHYPRSRMTRAACQEHAAEFMRLYGSFTEAVPVNLYAIARESSLVDYDQYVRTLRGEVDFIPVRPFEFGLRECDGAVLTGERHIVTDRVREYFRRTLSTRMLPEEPDPAAYDWTIDCTFGARDGAGVDRYEPCLVVLLDGPTDKAVTIMDGPFPSLYPWNEERGLSSLSSAQWTPFSKECRTWAEADQIIRSLKTPELMERARLMIDSMARFYPAVLDYRINDVRLSIRAMPASGADTRLVDIRPAGSRLIRVRAGKIDAIMQAGRTIRDFIGGEVKCLTGSVATLAG